VAFQWSTTLFEIVSFEVFIEELVLAPPSQWLSQDNFPNANLRVSKLENLSLHVQSSNELYKMRNIFRFDWILKKHNSIGMVCIKRLNNIAVRIMYKLGTLFQLTIWWVDFGETWKLIENVDPLENPKWRFFRWTSVLHLVFLRLKGRKRSNLD